MCPSSDGHFTAQLPLSDKAPEDLSIRNRILSIQHDYEYVKSVVSQVPAAAIVANERCGSWYVSPASRTSIAYFKSTDGHKGIWSFNTRRLNLGLLNILGRHERCFLVDSARRKAMPDALSKTVPIWVAVMNRLLFPERDDRHQLRTDVRHVSVAEQAQIEARLDHFLDVAKGLGLDVENLRSSLRFPIKLHFLSHRENVDALTGFALEECVHLVCLSASIVGIDASTSKEEFHYIPGAGDDAENWARGMTSDLLWENMPTMLLCSEYEEVAQRADDLVKRSKAGALGSATRSHHLSQPIYVTPSAPPFYIGSIHSLEAAQRGNLLVDAAIVCREVNDWASEESDGLNGPTAATSFMHIASDSTQSFPTLKLHCPAHKQGSRALLKEFRHVGPFLGKYFDATSEPRLLFACDIGIDLAIGVALATACLHIDADGRFRLSAEQLRPSAENEGKPFVRRRLVQILEQSGLDDAGGSDGSGIQRTTLNVVNSLVIARPTARRAANA